MATSGPLPQRPVQLVAFEARWAPDAVKRFPRRVLDGLLDVVPDALVELPAAADASQEPALLRLVSEDRVLSVSLWRSSLVVECSAYQDFDPFLDLVMRATGAVPGLLRALPVVRIGLRYIDELHAPDADMDPNSWQRWVAPELLGGASILTKFRVSSFGGGAVIELGRGFFVQFRFALTKETFSVPPPLQPRPRPLTPAMVFDTDGYWLRPATESASPFDIEKIVRKLNEQTNELINAVVTEDCRNLVFDGGKQ